MFEELIKKLEKIGKIQEGYEELLKLKEKSEITPELLSVLFLLEIKLNFKKQAISTVSKLIELDPNNSIAWANKANILNEDGNTIEALYCIEKSIEINNQISTNYSNKSNILVSLERYKEAIDCCDEAIRLDDTNKDGWMNKANVLFTIGNFESAEINAKQAVAVSPEAPEPWLNLGRIYNAQNRDTDALTCYEKALSLNPNFGQALINLGFTYARIGNTDLAVKFYEQAAECNPDLKAEVLWNIALIYLSLGRFEEGWKLYESRWEMKEFSSQMKELKTQRLDSAESCFNKHVFIYSEQGFGDCIQFSRLLLNLINISGKVTFQCHHTLVSLIKTISTDLNVISFNEVIPDHDFHLPLMSLPKILKIYSEDKISKLSYLRVPSLNFTHEFSIESDERFKVGIAWSGSSQHKNDANRSIDLKTLQTFISEWRSKISFYSLQKEYKKGEIDKLNLLNVKNYSSKLIDFGVTANFIAQLDLVICVDTAVAHVAASIGKPTWLLLSNPSDFRWLLDREDSPWYPKIRIFKQPTPGDWISVLNSLNQNLSKKQF